MNQHISLQIIPHLVARLTRCLPLPQLSTQTKIGPCRMVLAHLEQFIIVVNQFRFDHDDANSVLVSIKL